MLCFYRPILDVKGRFVDWIVFYDDNCDENGFVSFLVDNGRLGFGWFGSFDDND